MSHPHGCVSWNRKKSTKNKEKNWSHPHGCVSWNELFYNTFDESEVTPSRVCELKSPQLVEQVMNGESHPHGCVSWNVRQQKQEAKGNGHTLTGVWVEIWRYQQRDTFWRSHPHGCVSWN